MNTIKIKTNSFEYDFKIGSNLLEKSGQLIKEIKDYKRAVLVTDKNVDALYSDIVVKSLEESNIKVVKIVLESGEHTKSLEFVEFLIRKLVENKISRKDLMIGLGGGVIGDLVGFVSSIYLRGIDLVHIPTTLLAQVDSSIGGKVGVNLKEAKNLIGSFKHPVLIIADIETLKTIDDRVYRDGLGEVFKYACIDSESIFEKFEEVDSTEEIGDHIIDIITLCASIKAKYVEKDELDKGYRNTLNFGHTLAHAIEKYYNYEKYLHGEAVAIGMYNITRIGEKKGLTLEGTSKRLKNLLVKYKLPYKLEMRLDELSEPISLDKKNDGEKIKVVMLRKIGESFFYELTINSKLYSDMQTALDNEE